MGSGKSTIARHLSKQLPNTYFLDTDSLIEHFENQTIPEIFATQNEEYFRNAEKRVFSWICKNVSNTIISTGGGLPVYVPEIKTAGVVVYLKVAFEDILQRLSSQELSNRPLFQDIQKAKQLFIKRDAIYTQLADFTIVNNDLDTTTNEILQIINSKDIL